MNRIDLQKLSLLRLKEARTLFNSRLYCGAYYLAGSSIECALKACIAKRVREHDFPDKNLALESWKHDLAELMATAGLTNELKDATKRRASFAANWAVAKDWKENSRYDHQISRTRVQDLIAAISDRREGVLRWLKVHW